MKSVLNSVFVSLLLISASCNTSKKENEQIKVRIFEGYHPLLDEIIRSKKGTFRGVDLNTKIDSIKTIEVISPTEKSNGHLYYEHKLNDTINYSIDYSIENDSLQEISLQINCN